MSPTSTDLILPHVQLQEWVLGSSSAVARPMLLAEALFQFLFQFHSPATQRAYRHDILTFFQYLRGFSQTQEASVFSDPGRWMGKKWREDLASQGLSPTSINRKLAAVSSFFRYAVERQWLSKNPLEHLKRYRVSKSGKTPALDHKEILAVLQSARDGWEQEEHPRRRLDCHQRYMILRLLFSLGIRVQELCGLRRKDIQGTSEGGDLLVRSKGGRLIHYSLPSGLFLSLGEFIRATSGVSAAGPLFYATLRTSVGQPALVPRGGGVSVQPLGTRWVFSMLRESGEAAGLPIPLTPHVCRASLATLLHRQGVPLADIQAILGHRQLATTALYIRKSEGL